MANDNNSKGVENNGNTNGKRFNRKQERLVILFGDTEGKSLNPLHAFIRNMLWGLLWHLNFLFLKAVALKGPEGKEMQFSVLRKVARMMVASQYREGLERSSEGWLQIALADEPEKAQALLEIASALTDRKSRVTHHPIRFDLETGLPESERQAARRLLREAILHSNSIVADSYASYRKAIVKAGILTEAEAKVVTDAAKVERDERRKKLAAEKKVAKESPAKDDKKKEEKKVV